jgi:hypothetical protein
VSPTRSTAARWSWRRGSRRDDARPPPHAARAGGRLGVPRDGVRSIRRGVRRGRLQHEHDGISGGPDGPVLRGTDRHHDVPAPGELRHERRRRGERAHPRGRVRRA